MNFTNMRPPRDEATYVTPLSEVDKKLASFLSESTRSCHSMSVINLMPSILECWSMESVMQTLPEVCSLYANYTSHQTKGVIIADPRMDRIEVPYRRGNLRVRLPGMRCKIPPHLSFVGSGEIHQFVLFGTATICIVMVKEGGRTANLMGRLARAIKTGRIESVLVVREEKTTQDDWQSTYEATRRLGITVGYRDLSLEDLMR